MGKGERDMSWEGCVHSGHEIIFVKGEWYHKAESGPRAKLCFHDTCDNPEPVV